MRDPPVTHQVLDMWFKQHKPALCNLDAAPNLGTNTNTNRAHYQKLVTLLKERNLVRALSFIPTFLIFSFAVSPSTQIFLDDSTPSLDGNFPVKLAQTKCS